MARNEEKQLARLNRFYLHQQKEEQLKKNPTRPRLDSLNSAREIKKWLPSIIKDIEFNVTQMEVSCYPTRQIEEFERRVSQLRGEYKAFIQKIRQLEPDVDVNPWIDKPYVGKQRKLDAEFSHAESSYPNSFEDKSEQDKSQKIVLLQTPVLKLDSFYKNCYGYIPSAELGTHKIDLKAQSEPLHFNFSHMTTQNSEKQRTHDKQMTFVSDKKETPSLLNLPYSDSSSDEDSSKNQT